MEEIVRPRQIVAEFQKSLGKRLELFSLTVIEEKPAHGALCIASLKARMKVAG